MGKECTILGGQGEGGQGKKELMSGNGPLLQLEGKKRMVLQSEIYKIKRTKSHMTSKAEWDLSTDLVAFCIHFLRFPAAQYLFS